MKRMILAAFQKIFRMTSKFFKTNSSDDVWDLQKKFNPFPIGKMEFEKIYCFVSGMNWQTLIQLKLAALQNLKKEVVL